MGTAPAENELKLIGQILNYTCSIRLEDGHGSKLNDLNQVFENNSLSINEGEYNASNDILNVRIPLKNYQPQKRIFVCNIHEIPQKNCS